MFTGLVTTRDGREYIMEFNMDAPLWAFDLGFIPSEVVSVEILGVVL